MSTGYSIDTDQDAGLYGQDLINCAAAISLVRRLENPDITGEKRSRICGSRLILDLNINNVGKITDVGHDLQACALSRAVLAVFVQKAIGCAPPDIKNIRAHFKNWLDGHVQDLPNGWQDLDIITPARDYTPRHASMLLPFDAAISAFENYRASNTV